jgi:hypothetical protein
MVGGRTPLSTIRLHCPSVPAGAGVVAAASTFFARGEGLWERKETISLRLGK